MSEYIRFAKLPILLGRRTGAPVRVADQAGACSLELQGQVSQFNARETSTDYKIPVRFRKSITCNAAFRSEPAERRARPKAERLRTTDTGR